MLVALVTRPLSRIVFLTLPWFHCRGRTTKQNDYTSKTTTTKHNDQAKRLHQHNSTPNTCNKISEAIFVQVLLIKHWSLIQTNMPRYTLTLYHEWFDRQRFVDYSMEVGGFDEPFSLYLWRRCLIDYQRGLTIGRVKEGRLELWLRARRWQVRK